MCDTVNASRTLETQHGLCPTGQIIRFTEDSKDSSSKSSSIYMESEEEKSQQERSQTDETQEKKLEGSAKKKYDKISNDVRLKLIDAVENKGEKIKHVAKRLSINYSSAKSICQVFKREGRKMKKSVKHRVVKDYPRVDESGSTQQAAAVNQPGSNFTINSLICSRADETPSSPIDMLTKLQNRLIQGRNNSIDSAEKCDFPPYKKVHLESDAQSSEEMQQLQQIDKVIEQNHIMLSSGGSASNLILPTKNQNNNTPTQNVNNVDLKEQNGGSSSGLNQKLIKLMPSASQSQAQNFNTISNSLNTGSIGGYLIGNPSSAHMNLSNQGQQLMLNAGNSNQMEFVMSPYQTQQVFAQQKCYQMNQGDNKSVVIMPMAAQNRPVQYFSPMQMNTSAMQQQQFQAQPIFVQTPQLINFNNQPQQAYAQAQPVIYVISPNQPVANTQNITFAQNNFARQQQQPYIGQRSQAMNLDNMNSTRPTERNSFLNYSAQNTLITSPTEKKEVPQATNYQTKKVVFGGNSNPYSTSNLLNSLRPQMYN